MLCLMFECAAYALLPPLLLLVLLLLPLLFPRYLALLEAGGSNSPESCDSSSCSSSSSAASCELLFPPPPNGSLNQLRFIVLLLASCSPVSRHIRQPAIESEEREVTGSNFHLRAARLNQKVSKSEHVLQSHSIMPTSLSYQRGFTGQLYIHCMQSKAHCKSHVPHQSS